MISSKSATRFISGFGAAAIGLGIVLGVVWLGLWGLAIVGGPAWRMPIQLLQNAGTLVLIGWVLRLLLQSRTAKGAD